MLISGGCLCGATRYQVSAKPISAGHCHCENYRKHTGAAFATDATFDAAAVTWSGDKLKFYNSSADCARGFCAMCGSTVAAKYASKPDIVIIAAGSMDDPNHIEPTHHGYAGRKLAWIHLNDGLQRYETDTPSYGESET